VNTIGIEKQGFIERVGSDKTGEWNVVTKKMSKISFKSTV
jgi:hypothetical protein